MELLKNANIQPIELVCVALGWDFREESGEDGHFVTISRKTPLGNEIIIEACLSVEAEADLEYAIRDAYDTMDVDYETYIWLDSNGNGKNGAPTHIKDVLADMQEKKRLLGELWNAVEKILKF